LYSGFEFPHQLIDFFIVLFRSTLKLILLTTKDGTFLLNLNEQTQMTTRHTAVYIATQNVTIVRLNGRSQWSSSNMPDCGVRGPRFESHRGQLHAYRKHHKYSLGHGLHTLTAVPGSTQPSTLRWTLNGDGGCGFWQPTSGLTARVVWPGLRVGGRLAPCHIHLMNQVLS